MLTFADLSLRMNRIATWELWGEREGSQRRKLLISIHAPEPDPKSAHGDYRTLVEMDGLSTSRFAHGVNSMQSLMIATQLLRIELEEAIWIGWRFFFDAGDTEPFDLLQSIPIRAGKHDG